MGKKILLCCVMVLLMAAAADPLEVFAEGDPLASPTPRPTQRIAMPVISGVNPEVVLPEEDLGDITSSGSFYSQAPHFMGGVAPPPFVDLHPVGEERPMESLERDGSCGPAALAGALEALGAKNGLPGPGANELEDFLRVRGLMYDWGTGVEELVLAARSFGYPGTQAVHNWSLEELIRELRSGTPLVVPLGINGPDHPGHFVVLTGVSPDGEWITCSDPRRGSFQLSRDDFRSLWELQGSAGVLLAENSLPASSDTMLPWMGLLSMLSTLALVLKPSGELEQSGWYRSLRRKLADPRRKGVGGGIRHPDQVVPALVPGVGTEGPCGGKQTITGEIPIYETRQVQVGLRGVKRQVPVYETRRVQVGYKKEIRQVPTYKTVKVYSGTRLVRRRVAVTRYRIQKAWVWKKVISRVPVTRRFGSKRITVGYQNQTRWKRVQIDKKVPYRTTRIIMVKEPVYETKRVQSGTRTVTCWVPRYRQKQILVGYKTVEHTVPIFEERRGQVGTLPAPADQMEPGVAEDSGGEERGLVREELLFQDMLDSSPLLKENSAELVPTEPAPVLFPAGEKQLTDSWLYKTILFFQNIKAGIGKVAEKLGAPNTGSDQPHLFSFSAYEEAPLNLLNEEGILVNAYQPSWFLDLLYTKQEMEIGPKVVVTTYPDGLMDLNLSSKSWSMKLGKTTIFAGLNGEFGFGHEIDNNLPYYDYQQIKHSFRIDSNGVAYKLKIEGIETDDEKANDYIEIKVIKTLKCQITTIRTLRILIGAVVAVLLAALLYLRLNSGIPIPFPI